MRSECNEHRKKIPGLLLNDVTEEERQKIENHLAECTPCRMERESYARTLNLMKLMDDEPPPRHFFVHPRELSLNPWQLFCGMQLRWKALIAAAVAVVLLAGIAALSRLQIGSDGNGWMVRFGGAEVDVAALSNEILRTADARSREARTASMDEMRAEFERSMTDLTQKQQSELEAALKRLDTKFSKRILLAEDHMKSDTQEIAGDMYRAVSQRRAQDLDIINLRIDSIEASNMIKSQQTNTILDALLQEAELRLK